MTILQKIIKKFEQGRYPANEKLIPGWLEDEFGKQEEQQIRDAMFFGLETGLNESSTAPYRELETYIHVLTGKICGCGHCTADYQHKSDCAVHNEPAMSNGECDCKPI